MESLPLVGTADGLAIAGGSAPDRDSAGVLWPLLPMRPGVGSPLYEVVHPLRQRRAMRRLLCQVCAAPADVDDRGCLWVLPDHRADWPGWPEGMANTHPPLCVRCARISMRWCPHLVPGSVAVRARSTVVGVSGGVYRPGPRGPALTGQATARFGSPILAWMVAVNLVRELHDCRIVEL